MRFFSRPILVFFIRSSLVLAFFAALCLLLSMFFRLDPDVKKLRNLNKGDLIYLKTNEQTVFDKGADIFSNLFWDEKLQQRINCSFPLWYDVDNMHETLNAFARPYSPMGASRDNLVCFNLKGWLDGVATNSLQFSIQAFVIEQSDQIFTNRLKSGFKAKERVIALQLVEKNAGDLVFKRLKTQ